MRSFLFLPAALLVLACTPHHPDKKGAELPTHKYYEAKRDPKLFKHPSKRGGSVSDLPSRDRASEGFYWPKSPCTTGRNNKGWC